MGGGGITTSEKEAIEKRTYGSYTYSPYNTNNNSKEDIKNIIQEYRKIRINKRALYLLREKNNEECTKFLNLINRLIIQIARLDIGQAQKLQKTYFQIMQDYRQYRKKQLENINTKYSAKEYKIELRLTSTSDLQIAVQLSLLCDWIDETLEYFGLYKKENFKDR